MSKEKILQLAEYATWAVLIVCGLIAAKGYLSRELTDWRIAVPNALVGVLAIAAIVFLNKARGNRSAGSPKTSTESVDNR